MEKKTSICVFSGKYGGEFARKDAARQKLEALRGSWRGGGQKDEISRSWWGIWILRGNGEESRIQCRARVCSNYLRAVSKRERETEFDGGEMEYKLVEGWRGRWISLKINEIQTMIFLF